MVYRGIMSSEDALQVSGKKMGTKKTADNDHTFQCAKWAHRKQLRYNKYKHINSDITECGIDASEMYKLVFGLICKTNSNPMPPNISDGS